VSLDVNVAAHALRIAVEAQHGGVASDSAFSGSKHQARAFKRYVKIIGQRAQGARVLDVGSEPAYRSLFTAAGMDLVPFGLPDDMHSLTAQGEYDGIIASHVLEHSPFPLYILLLFAKALKPGGWLLVVVPHPILPKWVDRKDHFSVLQPGNWRRLLDAAGFNIVYREAGAREKTPGKTEERFLCVVKNEI
jgi:SAM-dependent methyltransferase